jgi:HSP20 family molecular chaperone IbpA
MARDPKIDQQASHVEVVEATAATEETMRPQTVPVNVYETGQALVIVAPLPAVTAADVTIELHPECVRFWARLRSAGPREYLVHEWDYGGYEREVDLPDGYGSGVEASLANGQLAIRVLAGASSGPLSIQPRSPAA